MNALATPEAAAGVDARTPVRPGPADFLELTKPGITRMVLLTTGVGFLLAGTGPLDWVLLLNTLIGTGLAASGTNALNQVLERDVDALMRRTRNRPLPAGRMSLATGATFATAISLLGIAWLLALVGALPAAVVAVTLVSYVFVYTPLKRVTNLSTLIGGIPGALPIVAGWTAAGGALDAGALVLFAILFLWQIPHFLALAYVYREDYRRGGLVMLTLGDEHGRRTARQAMLYSLSLVPVSLLLTLVGVSGSLYYWGALALGAAFLAAALPMLMHATERRAWRLFAASVAYLPALLVLMVVDRLI